MSTIHANLRLEPNDGSRADVGLRARRELESARRRVALENRLASTAPGLDPKAPHLAFAGRVANALEGVVLPPERREELLRFARLAGLREFDASLVIAVMQDRARRGESIDDITGPLDVLAAGRAPVLRQGFQAVRFGLAAGLAIGLATLAVRWLVGGV